MFFAYLVMAGVSLGYNMKGPLHDKGSYHPDFWEGIFVSLFWPVALPAMLMIDLPHYIKQRREKKELKQYFAPKRVEVFDEKSLRDEIIRTFGEHGAHLEVYDELLLKSKD